MTAPLVLDEPYTPMQRIGPNTIEPIPEPLKARVERLEVEVEAVQKTISELAGLVVGEIKERRATSISSGDSRFPEGSALPVLNQALKVSAQLQRSWLLVELTRECWSAVRMYFDPRYRVRRSTQLMIPVLLTCLVVTYVFFNYFFTFPVIGPILERLIEIILAVLMYKICSYEIARYRQSLAEYMAAGQGTINLPVQLLHHDSDAGTQRQGVE